MRHAGLPKAVLLSFAIHAVIFSVTTGVRSNQAGVIPPHIQVEIVQLPPAVQPSHPAPPAAAPVKVRSAATPVPIIREAVPSSTPVEKRAVLPVAAVAGPPSVTAPAASRDDEMTRVSVRNPSFGKGEGDPVPRPAGQPAATGKPQYYPFYRLSKLPAFRYRIDPAYPRSERNAGVEARVLVEVRLNDGGEVVEAVIRKSGGKPFDQAVLEAVRQSSFSPGYAGEKPVPAILQIPYAFKLK